MKMFFLEIREEGYTASTDAQVSVLSWGAVMENNLFYVSKFSKEEFQCYYAFRILKNYLGIF